MTATSSNSIGWPEDLWESAVSLFDSVIRAYYGVYEFTDDPGCVLRIGLAQARASILLSDGTHVKAGELIGTLHWWNEHLPRYSRKGPDLGWACALRDQVRHSLFSLALYIETESAWREVQALRGEAALSTRLGAAQMRRLARRYGFERLAHDLSILGWLHALGESVVLWSLTRAFNPSALARQPFLRDHHVLWISRAALLARYTRGLSPGAFAAPPLEGS